MSTSSTNTSGEGKEKLSTANDTGVLLDDKVTVKKEVTKTAQRYHRSTKED